jgi:hypothetical protein
VAWRPLSDYVLYSYFLIKSHVEIDNLRSDGPLGESEEPSVGKGGEYNVENQQLQGCSLHMCRLRTDGLVLEKPSDQFLDLICDESLTCRCLNLNTGNFNSLSFIFVSCGESHLLVSLCTGGRCDKAGNDEDHDRSRRFGAEDQG